MGSRMATHSTWCVIRLLSTVYSERHGGSIHLRAATPAADGFPPESLWCSVPPGDSPHLPTEPIAAYPDRKPRTSSAEGALFRPR